MDRVTAGEEARALLLLQGLPGVGDRRLGDLLARFGSGAAALRASHDAFAEVAGAGAARARTGRERAERIDEAMGWCREAGVRVVPRGGAGYPPDLLHLSDPPAVLFLRGDTSLLEHEIVAVVGSRRSTAYGRRIAADVAGALVRAGVVVASGLALGIDGAAHRAALEAGGKTLAVLGAGIDRVHPRSHARLFRTIAAEGLLVSEFLPGEAPLPHHFPRRNRILAALSSVVVVAEAARRSGALITARHATDLGVTVVAAPGPIYSDGSQGTLRLLRDGATVLVSPRTVLDQLRGRLGVATAARAAAPPPAALGADASLLWEALGDTSVHVDDLARRSGLAAGRALSALSVLEVSGWVRQEPGMRFLRRAEAP